MHNPQTAELLDYAQQVGFGRPVGSQFEALFEYATIGILIADHHGQIINFNTLAEQMFEIGRAHV